MGGILGCNTIRATYWSMLANFYLGNLEFQMKDCFGDFCGVGKYRNSNKYHCFYWQQKCIMHDAWSVVYGSHSIRCALQDRWCSYILIINRSWWAKPFGGKTCGETSGSTASGWFIRQYGTLPLFCQDIPYNWYVALLQIRYPGLLIKPMFSINVL